ncbi:ABC transporter substrate-binding protein [Nocardia sp. NPDC051981]|uniref:ABC transporter substrate-binding protein n=1 Tax=Nocardia sp. NPDC051981 TaxID=3155417 RepID=UPI00341A23D4
MAAACTPFVSGPNSDTVKLAVPWGGAELRAFEQVLTDLRDSHPFSHSTQVFTLGDDVGTVFSAGRYTPDIVVLPQLGQITRLAQDGRLRALDESLWGDERKAPRYAHGWWELVHVETVSGNRLYGLPFKASCKSLVWFDLAKFRRLGLPPPGSWAPWQWPVLLDRLARSGIHPLALGAADGWMLADFFANVLLAQSPDAYESVVSPNDWRPGQRHAEITRALETLAGIWGFPNAFPGSIGRALTQQFPDAVREVFAKGDAAMVVAPDFAEPIVRSCFGGDDVAMKQAVGVSLFPSVLPGFRDGPVIGGGDIMVLTRSAKDEAAELIRLLSLPDAPDSWIGKEGGFIAPDLRTRPAYSAMLEPLGPRVRSWSEFDLADRIGSRGGDNPLWGIITQFLMDLDGTPADSSQRAAAAVRTAVDAVYELVRTRQG